MVVQSKLEPKIEWFKDDKAITENDRMKFTCVKDEKDATKYTVQLEIKVRCRFIFSWLLWLTCLQAGLRPNQEGI